MGDIRKENIIFDVNNMYDILLEKYPLIYLWITEKTLGNRSTKSVNGK